MNLPEARDQLLDIADATVAIVGGEPWSNDLSKPDLCGFSAGPPGQQYALQKIGPGVDNPISVVHAVSTMWRARGMHVDESWVDKRTVRLAVHLGGVDDSYIRFGANENATVITALSVCVPDHVG